jgi:hypothetical protein
LYPQETEEFIHQKSTNVSSNLSEIKAFVYKANELKLPKKSLKNRKLRMIDPDISRLSETESNEESFQSIKPKKVKRMTQFIPKDGNNIT